MDSFALIPSHEDQVEIELEKLVPFGHYPFSWFQGQRLEEMVDEISEHDPIDIIDGHLVRGSLTGIRIISPIIVRPTTDDQYEILDGHYRVAAARKLKRILQLQSVKIPAIIKRELTDEEALSEVSDTNPIGLLLKHAIDIFCEDYRQSDGYKRLAGALISSEGNSSMALDEYIEHFLLDDHNRYDLYESIYSMGNPYELNEEECNDEVVAREILQIITPGYKEKMAKLEKSKEERDIDALSKLQATIEDEIPELVRTFVRKDSGYIQQLKDYLNFDLDAYDYDDIQNRRERAKLLFFVHMLKKRTFPHMNILQLLGRPSMENIDNSFLGWETSNGKYVKFVKHEVEKELSLTRKSNIKQAVSFVVNTWGDYINSLCHDVALVLATGGDCSKDIESIMSHMQAIFVYQKPVDCKFTPLTPLEAFYLRLTQNEYLGQLYDILKIFKISSGADYSVPVKYIKKMREFQLRKMSTEDIEKFFEPENIQQIAKYVYLKDETSKEERRKIRNSKEKVFRFFDFCKLADPLGIYNMMEDVTELLIISCLQSILLDSSNEIFDYAFHGFEGGKGYRKGKIRVQAALKNDEHTYDALQVYWVRRVMDRSYANVGDSNIRKVTTKIETRCIEALSRVLNSSTIEEMLEASSFYLNKSAE